LDHCAEVEKLDEKSEICLGAYSVGSILIGLIKFIVWLQGNMFYGCSFAGQYSLSRFSTECSVQAWHIWFCRSST